MATIKYGVVEITVSDPAEAVAIAKELNRTASVAPAVPVAEKQETPAIPASRPIHANGAGVASQDSDLNPSNVETALKFLKVIKDSAQVGGAQSEAMMTVFNVSVAKGIGSKSASVNKVIKTIGLRPKAVYINPRTPSGRLWKPGRQIGQAIQLLEQRLAAH